MDPYIVAISIDKVQTFLYYVLHAHVQEKQTNNDTLKDIINSSNLISRQFYQDIGIEGDQGAFHGQITGELLKCSGMCVFTTSLDKDQIMQRLNTLFEKYYKAFSGQLLLRFVCFEQKGRDSLQAIKESKNRLKQKNCLNEIIARNRHVLFEFNSSPSSDFRKNSVVPGNEYAAFSRTINALYSEEDQENANHFRIAVIKADLDGMGALFEGIDRFEVYQSVSRLLSDFICLDSLHKHARNLQNNNNRFKLYPLYIAGDDIFFAVSAAQLIEGVQVCKDILRNLNAAIRKLNNAFQPLSMSLGIDFTFNREPIRYYYERVQRQVDDRAKAAPPLQNNDPSVPVSCVKIAINDYVFYDIDKPKKENSAAKDDKGPKNSKHKQNSEDNNEDADKPNWHHFISHVKRLKYAMQQGFTAHHFFYGLLNKITDPEIRSNNIKYSNAVLYHLLPQYVDSPVKALRESELLILESLLKQLMVPKVKDKDNGKPEQELCFGTEQRKRLETYVRLLLLFSDSRFNITGGETTLNGATMDATFDAKRIKGTLFNKTQRYLYDKSLCDSLKVEKWATVEGVAAVDDLRKIFVVDVKYRSLRKGRKPNDDKVQVYRTLRISSSMFHRLKREAKPIVDQAANMLQAVNDRSIEEIRDLEKRNKEQQKAPPGLFFDQAAFCHIAKRPELWSKDYIDTLLIFYQFNEQSIRYKNFYSKKKQQRPRGAR